MNGSEIAGASPDHQPWGDTVRSNRTSAPTPADTINASIDLSRQRLAQIENIADRLEGIAAHIAGSSSQMERPHDDDVPPNGSLALMFQVLRGQDYSLDRANRSLERLEAIL